MIHHHETGYFGRAAPGKATPPHFPPAPRREDPHKTKHEKEFLQYEKSIQQHPRRPERE